MNNLPYRPNVCLFILNSTNKIFLGQRKGEFGVWQLPQGGTDGEDPATAALREAAEELGADSKFFSLVRKLKGLHEYDFTNVPDYAVGKWRGQSQTFWLLNFTGSDQDIQLDKYEAELEDFRWCSVQEIRMLAEPKRLTGYEKAMPDLIKFLSSAANHNSQ